MNNKDNYRVLGVKKTVNDKKIKRACQNLACNLYPNKYPGNQQTEARSKTVAVFTAVSGLALLQ
ncbi:MAG: DnaJ domain-containing protein [Anaerolineae bacterium]|nr:DnaJ domain-containing protein [Anaerolineae bacterium]